MTSVTDALGGVVSFGYDLLGNLLSRTDQPGHVTERTYDALGRIIAVTEAAFTSVERTTLIAVASTDIESL